MENTVEIERMMEIRGEYEEIRRNREGYEGIRVGIFGEGWEVVWNCNCPPTLHNVFP